MKVTYTGRQVDLSPAQSEKLTAEFVKIGRMLDNGAGDAHAHVVLRHERHLHYAEVTVPYHHHELVGESSDADLFTAIHAAVGKLEQQAVRLREKWRDSKRAPRKETDGNSEEAGSLEAESLEAGSSGQNPNVDKG